MEEIDERYLLPQERVLLLMKTADAECEVAADTPVLLLGIIARLRKALAFYAVHDTYEEGVPLPGHLNGPVPIDADKGTQARQALGHWASLNLYWRQTQ